MGVMTVGPEPFGSFTLNDVRSHFITFCPHCSTGLKIRSVYKGRAIRCKQCHDKFWVGEADGPHTTNSNGGGAIFLAQAPPKEAPIVVTCPGCAATLRVRHSLVGHRVACKRCAHVFICSCPMESPLDQAHAGPPATTSPGAVPSESQSKHVESDTRFKALQSESDRLLAENQQLKTRKQQLKIRKQQLKTELQGLKDAYDRLSSENQKLRTALDRTQEAHDRQSEQLDRATAEVEGIRAELGEVTPAEVRSLADERASLRFEVERLGGEIQHLRDEQSAHDHAADQLKRRHADLNAALAEVDRCAGLLKERDEELDTARADLHRLDVNRQKVLYEAEQLRFALAEREETMRDEASRLRAEGERLRSEVEDLRRTLDHLERTHGDEHARLEHQLHETQAQSQDVEVLRGEADRLRTEREQHRAEGERLRSEVEELRRTLEHLERTHRDECARLHAELTVFAQKHDRIRHDESIRLLVEQQEPHQELVDGLTQLVAASQTSVDAPRSRPRLAFESNETFPSSPHTVEQAEPPKDEPAPSAEPPLSADAELQAARGQVDQLIRQLARSEKRQNELASMLEGFGVQFSAGRFKNR
jgi:chromosome segregation ATPase